MKLTSTGSRWRRPHDRRQRFCRSCGRATPSRRRGKIAQPRVQHNPAGIHLISAGRCPNKRRQLSEALLCLFVKRNLHDAILGDLQEDFSTNLRTHGYRRARFMYWAETLRSMASLLPSLLKRPEFWGFLAEIVKTLRAA